jgi:Flp pilus assembly protein CpaB
VENILSSKLFATRRGTIMLGIAAAVLAAIALLVYLNQYRNSVNNGVQPISVLVAKSLIPKGTPGDVVGTTKLYTVASIPRDQVKNGAYVDPKTLTGKVASVDIYPAQQLTSSDFAVADSSSLTQSLARDERAVVIALDSPGEVGGQIVAGDKVDVWVAFNAVTTNGVSKPVVHEVLQNMYVLNAGSSGGNVTLRATSRQSGMLIYASSNAKVWLVLRPAVGTVNLKPPTITAADLLGLPGLKVGG